MWNNYYDTVKYTEKSDKVDVGGNKINIPPKSINVRQVSGGKEQVISKDGVSIHYTKEYQIPFMVKEGDKIDDRQVVYVEASKGVFGEFHFCIAKVE